MSAIPTKFRSESDEIHEDRPTDEGARLTRDSDERDWLDREHQARVSRVASCDTRDGRRTAAENEAGLLTEEEQELLAERKMLGGDEHLDAIDRSGWYPYQRFLRIGSRLAMVLDAVLWMGLWAGLWWLWKRYYEDSGAPVPAWVYIVGPVLVPLAGFLCARAAKGFGQHFAVTRLTETASVVETIDLQVRVAGKSAVAAGALILAILALLFFAPPSWSSWVSYLSGLVAFGANITLGLSAGVGGNAADLLSKPGIRDSIDCAVDMKRRTRRVLSRYLAAVLLAAVCVIGISSAGVDGESVLVLGIDVSDSVDPVDRAVGAEGMVRIAASRAREIGASAILVIKFSDGVMLSEMIWVRVPPVPVYADCTKVEPAPMLVKGIIMLSPTLATRRKRDAVEACLARQQGERLRDVEANRVVAERLRAAISVVPRGDVRSRIVPLLEWVVSRPWTIAVDLLTDGVDNSGVGLSRLRIPDRVKVTLVLTRPNPKRVTPTLDEVLRGAEAWARVPGIRVTSVGEYAGVWSALARAQR